MAAMDEAKVRGCNHRSITTSANTNQSLFAQISGGASIFSELDILSY
jgi:hypothetical protein